MKKYISVAFLLFIVAAKVNAQWQPAPYTSGNIFFNGGSVGIGTSMPAEMLDVFGNIQSKGLKVTFNGNAFIQTRGTYAGFLAESGDGTSSTRFSFTDYATRETAPLTWRIGMNGTKSFSIVNMTTNVQRVSLTEGGDFTVNGKIQVMTTGNAFMQTYGTYAGFLAESGNGTSSTRYSFTDYTTRETAPLTWRVGMNGAKSFSIVNMTTNVQRVTLTEGGDFTVNGNILATGNIAAKYQDVAEWVPAATEMAAGTVVVLHPERPNEVMPSSQAYDTTVAGVVSAQPGLILGEAGEARAKIATMGRVKVKVDATKAPVKIGDLLVSSDRPGYAMKSQPLDLDGRKIHQPGTVIGKALEPLTGGEGEILVLLSLQ